VSFIIIFDTLSFHIETHTRLTALCPGWAGTRKVKPIWTLLKQETVSGSGISWAICMSAPRSRQITTPAPHRSVFYRPDALPAAQPTASKHWRNPTVSVPKTFIEAACHWSVPVNGKEQSQCCDGLLPARQVVHRPEPLTWRHAVVIDAVQVRLLGVLRTQERLRALVLRQRLSTHRHSAVYSTLRA